MLDLLERRERKRFGIVNDPNRDDDPNTSSA